MKASTLLRLCFESSTMSSASIPMPKAREIDLGVKAAQHAELPEPLDALMRG